MSAGIHVPLAPARRRSRFGRALPLCLLALLGGGCDSKPPAPAAKKQAPAPTPDRLTQAERLPESEVAFGLSLPPGLRLTRKFDDSAYFLGRLDLADVLAQVQERVDAHSVEMMGNRAVFARAKIKGDDSGRWVRIEVSRQLRGTQLYIEDLTPPPAPKGATQAQMWSLSGRNPDGTPKDENQQY